MRRPDPLHDAAYQWVRTHAVPAKTVLDIGGRDINGTPRSLFPGAVYTSVDLSPGPGVDVVADITKWIPPHRFDVVVCCEVLEHTKNWRQIVKLDLGDRLIVTAAGPGREPHSAFDGGPVRNGEWYQNIDPETLRRALREFSDVTVDVLGDDVRAVARRRR